VSTTVHSDNYKRHKEDVGKS